MLFTATSLASLIEKAFPDAQVVVEDLTGKGDHFAMQIITAAFENLTRVARHRLVYAQLPELQQGGGLHALALATYTPAEAQARDAGE